MKMLVRAALALALLVALSLQTVPAAAGPLDDCRDQLAPDLVPPTDGLTLVCHPGLYLAAVDPVARIPRWVAYKLSAEHVLGCLPRSGSFHDDPALPADQQASHAGYAGTPFDVGHYLAATDGGWSAAAMHDTFTFTNAAPQASALNRGLWASGEEQTRAWAWDLGEVWVLVASSMDTLEHLRDGTAVPAAFSKVLYGRPGEVHAFAVANAAIPGRHWTDLRVPLAAASKMVGWQLPTIAGWHDDGADWPDATARFEAAFKRSCPR